MSAAYEPPAEERDPADEPEPLPAAGSCGAGWQTRGRCRSRAVEELQTMELEQMTRAQELRGT